MTVTNTGNSIITDPPSIRYIKNLWAYSFVFFIIDIVYAFLVGAILYILCHTILWLFGPILGINILHIKIASALFLLIYIVCICIVSAMHHFELKKTQIRNHIASDETEKKEIEKNPDGAAVN